MSETITVEDCLKLQKKFNRYCETAEQQEFLKLLIIQLPLEASVAKIEEIGEVINQKEARAMFRIVLRAIGEDCSGYEEEMSRNERKK